MAASQLRFGFSLPILFSEEVEKWGAFDPISLMDEKWGAHDPFFLSSLTWMVVNWGALELPGFKVSSHALICFKLSRIYLFLQRYGFAFIRLSSWVILPMRIWFV
jgi:hypothetical protein